MIEWASLLNVSPIYHEFEPVTTGPVTYKFPGRSGGNISRMKSTIKGERRSLAPKLDMKMRRIMIAEIHSDNDSEERGNDRHGCLPADSGVQT